jgi:hypothetical protein
MAISRPCDSTSISAMGKTGRISARTSSTIEINRKTAGSFLSNDDRLRTGAAIVRVVDAIKLSFLKYFHNKYTRAKTGNNHPYCGLRKIISITEA